jgi:hypothetical protein
MIPAGYMAKRVHKATDWLQPSQVVDIYSISGHISEDFADYIHYWKHNGYWLFNSAEIIRSIAVEESVALEGTSLFYYEAYELEFAGKSWQVYATEPSFPTDVALPMKKQLEGFDVVTFYAGAAPECSPLSCNGMAKELHTNVHCLFATFEEAKTNIENGAFKNSEPGPYRIFSVYSVHWPDGTPDS